MRKQLLIGQKRNDAEKHEERPPGNRRAKLLHSANSPAEGRILTYFRRKSALLSASISGERNGVEGVCIVRVTRIEHVERMFGRKKKTAKTILIVEDEASLRRALEEKFSHAGFRALTAANGEEGLEVGLDAQPDLILLDIIMPRLDGLKMLKALRADKGWGADVPVMILTNSREKGDIVAALQEGVTQYLAKADWHIEDIVTRARELLKMTND